MGSRTQNHVVYFYVHTRKFSFQAQPARSDSLSGAVDFKQGRLRNKNAFNACMRVPEKPVASLSLGRGRASLSSAASCSHA